MAEDSIPQGRETWTVLASMYLWKVQVSHKADMDEAGDGLLQALQTHNKGLPLHRQVE